jgi:transposase InsO family protein
MADQPGQVWTADITYTPTWSGWLYLASSWTNRSWEVLMRIFSSPSSTSDRDADR